jgi:hypothetical protein
MAESSKKKSTRSKVRAVPDAGDQGGSPTEAPSHAASACPVPFCPICSAVTLLQPLNPEVIEHLLNAGREMLLATKAALDAFAGGGDDERDGSLEKIDIG